jgi:Asp-tRNA(Asn)/Glu-tRNA(Gln) amidotransferase A subunit family amidase
LSASVLCQGWRQNPALIGDLAAGALSKPGSYRGAGADVALAAEGSVTLPILGVPEGPYLEQTEPAALELFENQLARLQEAGITIKRIPAFQDLETIRRHHLNLVYSEFSREHKTIYDKHRDLWKSGTLEMVEEGLKVTDDELHRARRHCGALRGELEQIMIREGIDLWICPSATGPAPEGIGATGDPIMNLPWTHVGMPVVTLPAGKAVNGLPLGLQLIAPFCADEYLLAWAHLIEDIPSLDA